MIGRQEFNGIYRIVSWLIFVRIDGDWFQIFCLENLFAVEAFHVVNTVSSGDNYRLVVITHIET